MVWEEQVASFVRQLPANSPLAKVLQGNAGARCSWPPTHCPACGAECSNPRSPYCGEACREESGFVRQVRAAIAADTPLPAERLETLGHVLWAILGGGHPERLKLLNPSVIAKVLQRDNHACHQCGQPGDFVEHLRTACNRPINLGVVCPTCRRTRDLGDPHYLAKPEVEQQRARLAGRILANKAARRCDDPAGWDWRAFLQERQT